MRLILHGTFHQKEGRDKGMGERWREPHLIQSDNCNFKKQCRLSTLLEWMQRAGDAHLADNGIMLDNMIQQGMAWMLVTVDLELIQQPQYNEQITVATWHKGSKGVQWFRDYRITDQAGEIIGQARTTWVLVDIQKRRILRASAFPFPLPEIPQDADSETPSRVEIPTNTELESIYEFTVRQSSLDMNGHMNNARFADVSLDALTVEQLEGKIKRFHITYHHEAVLGESFTVSRSNESLGDIYLTGTSAEGTRYFDACITLQ